MIIKIRRYIRCSADFSQKAKFPLWRSNYGFRARIGIIHPGGGDGHISDFYKIAPKGVSCGSSGVPLHKDESAEEMMHLDEHVVEAAKIIAGTKPDVIAWVCTAGSFLKGKGHDERLIKEMEKATNIACTTTSTAIMAALKELGIKRLCLVTPYPKDVNEIEKKFIEDNGVKVVKADGLDLVEIYVLGHLSPNVLYRTAKAADVPESDGLFISCTGLDTFDIIEPLEYDLKKPVITSNQASYWLAFKMAGVGEPIKGYGTLLDRPR